MAESVSLELIGRTVLETRDAVHKLSGVPEALRQLQPGLAENSSARRPALS